MILDMVDLVASGDGLYEDKYEEDKYTYKGANPNNYITFNGEKAGWRIISIEKSGIIKIVKSDSIGKMAWDSSSTNWAKPASLNTYLNETYYNNKLTSTAKNMIVSHSFGIGAVTDRNNNLTEQIKEENSVTWTGKVALITLSEFIRGSSNQEKCGTFAAIDNLTLSNADSLCGGTNWMFDWVRYRWFLSPMAGSSNIVFYLTDSYSFRSGYTISRALDVTPAIYLSSDIKITGGDGSQSNPYQISL